MCFYLFIISVFLKHPFACRYMLTVSEIEALLSLLLPATYSSLAENVVVDT